MTRRARRDDRGQAGGIEALPFGVLVFVVGTLLVAQAWAVIDAKLAADAAARQATRTFVEADVAAPGAYGEAEAAARHAGLAALTAHGRSAARADVRLVALSGPPGGSGYVRCARATFAASYRVPLLTLPWLGGVGRGVVVRGSHSELVDPYRDGVPGSAEACG